MNGPHGIIYAYGLHLQDRQDGGRHLLEKSEIAGFNSALVFELQKKNLPRSLVKIQYCGDPPWPRGSMLSLRPPGLAFRILCQKGSVISFISSFSGGSPGPVKPIDIWLNPHSFHFILLQGRYIFSIWASGRGVLCHVWHIWRLECPGRYYNTR